MRLLYLLPPVLCLLSVPAYGQVATSRPVGYLVQTIPAGQTRSFSVPFDADLSSQSGAVGPLTAVGATTMENSAAGWTPGAFSSAAAPYFLRLTSGAHAGRSFRIVTPENTATRLTLANDGVSAPTITMQPADRVISVGTGTMFAVTATGSPTLRYQWKRNGTAIPGANGATYEFSNAPLSASDSYQVDVTNDVGTTPSRVATLSVLDVQPTHAIAATSAAGYVPGGTVTITNTITYAGAPTSLGWQVLLPTGWSYASDAGTAPQTKPSGTSPGLAEWTWTTVPPSPVTFTYTLNVPGNASGPQALTAQLVITQGTVAGLVLAKSDPLIVPAARLPHSADTSGATDGSSDYRISIAELSRLIQLYTTRKDTTRTGAYAVATTATEDRDGFTQDLVRASGVVVTLARYHSSDTNYDGTISLLELTRGIELYNYRVGTERTGQYHIQADTEDGFAPGP